jgi:acetyl-CoA carboxylase biotin carboxylase subunit
MISKLIVWGKTRDEAIRRMRRALYEYKITGVKTSIKILERIMNNAQFIDGKYDTHFIEKNEKELLSNGQKEDSIDMVIIAAFIDYLDKIGRSEENKKEFAPAQSRWKKIPYINHF